MILFDPSGSRDSPSLVFDWNALPHARLCCSLGVLFNSLLLLKVHVAIVVRRVFVQIHLVHHMHLFLAQEDLQAVTHAIVIS